MPRRLIRIGTKSEEAMLIETNSVPKQYVALSHRWGKQKLITTGRSTISERMKAIPFNALSDTFKEAMFFASKLGFEYIWIDCLCIVQDDEADWRSESSRMGIIYREASLVLSIALETEKIVKDMVHGYSQGFLVPRSPSYRFPNKHRKYECEPEEFIVHEPLMHMNVQENLPDEDRWPLFTRGWTLQERLLATRVLHITPNEVIWECKTEACCECYFLDDHRCSWKTNFDRMLRKGPSSDELAAEWRQLVRKYTDRSLSRDSDRLLAISGLAQQCNHPDLGPYRAGIWGNYLLQMILWFKNTEAGGPKGHRRPASYIAPTWSWASLIGYVDWNHSGLISTTDFVADIIDSTCETDPENPFGAVSKGHLVVSSPYLTATVRIDREKLEEPILEGPFPEQPICELDADPVDGKLEVDDGQEVKCWFMNKLTDDMAPGLIIKPSNMEGTVYTRVGRVILWEGDPSPPLSVGTFKIE